MSAVAIIPARGGSKRIPRKNIRPFHGRPMIGWPIAAARASGLFERIIVSTDDAEIAEVARAEGAEVPFLRDPGLADDRTGVTPVVQDVLRRCAADGALPDRACLIYATAPFLRAEDLQAGLRALDTSGADFANSVASFPAPVQRAMVVEGGRLRLIDPATRLVRSQDLPEAFHDAGQFCWGRSAAWLSDRAVFDAPTAPVVLPRYRVQDVDTPEDWNHAELLARVLDEHAT
jgi:N-acylneuraminate cytidylyltransferase